MRRANLGDLRLVLGVLDDGGKLHGGCFYCCKVWTAGCGVGSSAGDALRARAPCSRDNPGVKKRSPTTSPKTPQLGCPTKLPCRLSGLSAWKNGRAAPKQAPKRAR